MANSNLTKTITQRAYANGFHQPGIYLYPNAECAVQVGLHFKGAGFMTSSTPAYNGRWRVRVDPAAPFRNISQQYEGGTAFPFLDYDGFRDGEFQTKHGWNVPQEKLIDWQREHLGKLGFREHEIDDANYNYGRLLLERAYPEKYFAVYPQETAAVEASVALEVDPRPDYIYRLWLYFVPVDEPRKVATPPPQRCDRHGFSVIELGYLTDREIPDEFASKAHGNRKILAGHRLGHHLSRL